MLKYTAKEVEEKVNVSLENPLIELTKLLAGCVGIVVACYALLGILVQVVAPRIPPETELQLAPLFVKEIPAEQQGDKDKERMLQAMLENLVDVYPDAPFAFKLRLVESEMINAVSLPGGNIVVFTGMTELAQTDREMAFILAHELGHYRNRDHMKGLGRRMLFMVSATALFGENNMISRMLAQSVQLTELHFSRSDEHQADMFALALLDKAGYPLNGGIRFLKRMNSIDRDTWSRAFLSTHPTNTNRIKTLEQAIEEKTYSLEP